MASELHLDQGWLTLHSNVHKEVKNKSPCCAKYAVIIAKRELYSVKIRVLDFLEILSILSPTYTEA